MPLGADREAGEIVKRLRGLGVRTRRILRSPSCRTDVAAVIVHRRTGSRRFLVPDRRALERGRPASFLIVAPAPGGRVDLDRTRLGGVWLDGLEVEAE